MTKSIHTFHIPVMGLAYTIDSPVKVARFGISSVVSIVEDTLIEKMRKLYYQKNNEEYIPITSKEEDFRAKRITDYLNLLNRIVQKQFEELKASAFEKGSELCLYFEMLPEGSPLKESYVKMMGMSEGSEKESLQTFLKGEMQVGSIDVNIMTKLDSNRFDKEGNPVLNGSDALAALRGYAKSTLINSSIIFSAGMNPRLYNYIESFDQLTVLNNGKFDKKIVIKVSDYRSSLIQGKFLAKKGIWVSEFRIESGLNCGGHAFASDGYLAGPILEEFKENKENLILELFNMYKQYLESKNLQVPVEIPETKITYQGGIGTYDEDKFLREYYKLDGTGWGSPFLLVPEATTVDSETLEAISKSTEKDVVLSKNSPLGVRFHYLKGISGETEKHTRVLDGKPGSPCTEKFLAFNTDYTTTPICIASKRFLKHKLETLFSKNLPEKEYQKQREEALTKECLCVGLSNSALKKYNEEPIQGNSLAVTICPGPNIVYFSKIASLKEMVDHIYGRINLMTHENRPHVFVKELKLYVNYLVEQVEDSVNEQDEKLKKYYQTFCKNLIDGVNYYKNVGDDLVKASSVAKEKLLTDLQNAEDQITHIVNVINLRYNPVKV